MGKIKWNCRELDSDRPGSKSKSLGLGSCYLSSTPDFKQLASADSFGDLDQPLALHSLYVYRMLWAEDSLPLRCAVAFLDSCCFEKRPRLSKYVQLNKFM